MLGRGFWFAFWGMHRERRDCRQFGSGSGVWECMGGRRE